MNQPSHCNRCPKRGEGFTAVEGSGRVGLLIVGESSGDAERIAGLPFRPHAPSGSLLERALRRVGLRRDDVAITNVMRCQPDGEPHPAAIEHCRKYLDDVIRQYKPRAIFALGTIAMRTLTGDERTISEVRGYVLQSSYGIPVVSSYHPAYLRRGGGDAGHDGMKLLGVLYYDLSTALKVARHGYDSGPPLDYQLQPTPEEAERFVTEALSQDIVAFDIETELGGEGDDKRGVRIEQIQFSCKPGSAICMPWVEPFIGIARRLLESAVAKVGHNAWDFDVPVLERNGVRINGTVHDTMEMWRRYHPDLPAGLQFVASFVGFPMPWKSSKDFDIRFYGCCDADATIRIMQSLRAAMEKIGCWRSYERHVLGLEPILHRMSDRGIAIDMDERIRLMDDIRAGLDDVSRRIFEIAPPEICPIHPKEGYNHAPAGASEGAPTTVGGKPARWCIVNGRWAKRLEFNPSSQPQLLAYMKLKGYPIPTNRDTGRASTVKTELERIANKYGDELLRLVIRSRDLNKLLSTYLLGWEPGPDGRIHSHFGHGTGTGQLTSRDPNVQNLPARGKLMDEEYLRLARRFRSLIVASPGHWLVEFDLRNAHALTLGFEAQDPDYMRMARIDLHSFVALVGLLKLETPERLIALPDEELKAKIKWYRKNWKAKDGTPFDLYRNSKAKPAVLGYGFAMGPRTLYMNNRESFSSIADAKAVLSTLDALFPRQPAYRARIRSEAAKNGMLISRHGYVRWFWDVGYLRDGEWVNGADAEACVAFLPANDAHGYLKDKMLALEERGLLERYRLINQIHDALLFEVPESLVDEALHTVKEVLESPDPILTDPVVAPDGLSIECEAKVGRNWGEMEERA